MARSDPDPSARPATRSEPAAVPTPPLKPPFLPRANRLRYVWPFVCLLQLGLIGGWVFTRYVNPLHPAGPESPGAGENNETAETLDALKPGEVPTVERGDELMREGRYDLALKVYDPLAGPASGALRDALQYRVALCQEGLGRTDQALKAYRVVGRTEHPRAAAAAQIGQARVLLRLRQPAEAKNLLYPLLLRSGTPELRDQPYFGDARYLLGLTLSLALQGPEKPGPLSDALAEYTASDWPVEAALEWVGTPREAKPDAAARPGEGTRAERPAAGEPDSDYVLAVHQGLGSESRVSAAVPQTSLPRLIQRLAERARLKVAWTEAASKVAATRTATVAFEDLPVGDVLIDVILPLTDPLGLLATLRDGTLRLATEAETPSEAVAAYRARTAQRALNNAITSYPGHRLTAATYLALGNLSARAGDFKDAAGRYDRLCRELRRSPLVVEANYNLGLVRLKQGQMAEARAAFYAARDHAPGHELAPLALLQVGRTFLLEGAPEQAVKPLADALAVSAGTPTQPAAALTLAAAYLLTGKPQLASRTVREHREPIGQPPYRATGIFLDAYGQLLAVKGKASAREASELLAALWAVEQREPVLGPVGPLLIGRAYGDLDQLDEMIAVYQKALPRAKGPLAAEMSYAVAEDLYQRNQREPARKLYLTLARGNGDRWTAAAQLRLAEIALLENKPRESLQMCRRLLDEKLEVKREELLRLMGQAFEKNGDYRQAARCFAGQLPE